MSAAKIMAALLVTLDGDVPDHAALDEALTILAAGQKRQSKADYRAIYIVQRDGHSLMLGDRGACLVHQVGLDGVAVIARRGASGVIDTDEKHRDRSAGGALVVERGAVRWDDDAAPEVAAAYAGFRWPWREVADGLAAALRALPPRTRARKVVRCPGCQREFVP